MRKIPFILLLATVIVGCNRGQDGADDVVDNPVEVMGDTLTVPANSVIASRLVCGTVVDTAFTTTLTTTGEVMAIPSSYAEVAAPFAGRVVRSLVRMGQTVKAGTPLFEISSSDYAEVVKNYIQTKSEMDMAKRALDRTQDLHDNKVASIKELDEAKTAYGLALEDYRHATAVAKEYQIDLRNAEVGQPMVVRSPIGGRVLSNNLVIGEYLKEDADAKVVVADLDKVWVNANVSEMDAPSVDGIKDVEVRPCGIRGWHPQPRHPHGADHHRVQQPPPSDAPQYVRPGAHACAEPSQHRGAQRGCAARREKPLCVPPCGREQLCAYSRGGAVHRRAQPPSDKGLEQRRRDYHAGRVLLGRQALVSRLKK